MGWDGMGGYGTVWDGMGRYGRVWEGMYGRVWEGMGSRAACRAARRAARQLPEIWTFCEFCELIAHLDAIDSASGSIVRNARRRRELRFLALVGVGAHPGSDGEIDAVAWVECIETVELQHARRNSVRRGHGHCTRGCDVKKRERPARLSPWMKVLTNVPKTRFSSGDVQLGSGIDE